ncbi:unnamed protein product [Phytophthora fragariaefolia]|uniref:Unnamed protein product n=1 Tax=Phytophthora fragariaefolia TaxID=1490495 RepID=A0A9W6YI41_9STRA|nr:unnamed protein product [Phytophthora fragariaefolia]
MQQAIGLCGTFTSSCAAELSSVSSPFDSFQNMKPTDNSSSNSITMFSSPQHSRSLKRKTESESVAMDDPVTKRPYLGKCQYKTGKCFNQRTLKRNGEAHSLCEEHRIKQNLIQRRSDRKYKKVHAIRRRERSQRRAELKMRASVVTAQSFMVQQQNDFDIPLPQFHVPRMSMTDFNYGAMMAIDAGLAPRIEAPQP